MLTKFFQFFKQPWLATFILVGLALPQQGFAKKKEGTYFSIKPDTETCDWPTCGGYYIRKLNGGDMLCGGGNFANECYVAEVAVGINLYPVLHSGQEIVVRGVMEKHNVSVYGEFGFLRISEVWVSEPAPGRDPAPADGSFFKVSAYPHHCNGGGCFDYRMERLNSNIVKGLSGFDGHWGLDTVLLKALVDGPVITQGVVHSGGKEPPVMSLARVYVRTDGVWPCDDVTCGKKEQCIAYEDYTAGCEDVITCGGQNWKSCPGKGTCNDDPRDICSFQSGEACDGVCTCDVKSPKCTSKQMWDGSPEICACVNL
jgi:hypothetical protein